MAEQDKTVSICVRRYNGCWEVAVFVDGVFYQKIGEFDTAEEAKKAADDLETTMIAAGGHMAPVTGLQ